MTILASLYISGIIFPCNHCYSQWIQQGLGFELPGRAAVQLIAINENVVWGIGRIVNSGMFIQTVVRTLNGGLNWELINIPGYPDNSMYNFSAVDQDHAWFVLIAGTPSTLTMVRTTDGGQTFQEMNPVFYPNTIVTGVHFFDVNRGFVSGYSNTLGIMRFYTTDDAGLTWQCWDSSYILNQYIPNESIVPKYTVKDSMIRCISSNGRMFTSHDWGRHWSVNITPFYINTSVYQIAFKENMVQGLVWGYNALYETFNGGITWSQVIPGVDNGQGIVWIPGTSNTCIRFSTSINEGCFYSTDGGHTWTEFPELHGKQLTASAWWDNQTGWIAEYTKEPDPPATGMFRFDSIFTAVPPVRQDDLIELWPNPCNEILHLQKFNIFRSHADFQVMNSLGQIRTDVSFTAGDHKDKILMNVSQLSAGLYFLRISTPDKIYCKKFVVAK